MRTDGQLQEAYNYCRAFTRQRATSFYYAFSALPAPQRHAIYACYTFAGQCDDIADEPMAVERKLELLQEQHQRLRYCYDGTDGGASLADIALADAVSRYRIPRSYFEELLEGVAMDLTVSRFATFDDLYHYCYRVASVIGLICIEVFGYREPVARQYAIDMGLALQLTNIMRDIKEDAERDRIYIPQDELARFGYSEADIFGGVINDSFHRLMEFQALRAEAYFHRGRRLLPLITSVRSRMCVNGIQGVYYEILRRIRASNYDVYTNRITVPKTQRMALLARLWMQSLLPARDSTAESSSSAAA